MTLEGHKLTPDTNEKQLGEIVYSRNRNNKTPWRKIHKPEVAQGWIRRF